MSPLLYFFSPSFIFCLTNSYSSLMEKLKPWPKFSTPFCIHTLCTVILQQFSSRGGFYFPISWMGWSCELCWPWEYYRNGGVSRRGLRRLDMLLSLCLYCENIASLTYWIMRHMEQSLVGSILAKAQTCQESSLEEPAQLTSLLTAHTWMSPAEISQAGIRSVGPPPHWHINLEEWEMFLLSHKLYGFYQVLLKELY